MRHLFPHWTCRRFEEISNAPRVRNTLVYSSREELEIFGSSEIGLLSRVWGLCALQCDPVSSTWAGIEECLSENPRRETGILPPAAYPGAGPCVSECLVTCSLTGVGELHMGPTLVTIMSNSGVNITWLWTGWCHPDSPHPLSPTSQISLVSLLVTVPA